MQALLNELEIVDATMPDNRKGRRARASIVRRLNRRIIRQARRNGETERLQALRQLSNLSAQPTPQEFPATS